MTLVQDGSGVLRIAWRFCEPSGWIRDRRRIFGGFLVDPCSKSVGPTERKKSGSLLDGVGALHSRSLKKEDRDYPRNPGDGNPSYITTKNKRECGPGFTRLHVSRGTMKAGANLLLVHNQRIQSLSRQQAVSWDERR